MIKKCSNCDENNINLVNLYCNHNLCFNCLYKLKNNNCQLCDNPLNEELIALKNSFNICLKIYEEFKSS
jgi:hypothetical protein